MLLNQKPVWGRDYGPGWPLFQTKPGSLLSHGIAHETAEDDYEAGLLVATHVATIISPVECCEATGDGYVRAPLVERLDPRNREVVCWSKQPLGLTPEASRVVVNQALVWAAENVPYDFWLLTAGYLLTDPENRGLDCRWENPAKLICSESWVRQALAAAHLMDPPQSMDPLRTKNAAWWDPASLDRAPVWVT